MLRRHLVLVVLICLLPSSCDGLSFVIDYVDNAAGDLSRRGWSYSNSLFHQNLVAAAAQYEAWILSDARVTLAIVADTLPQSSGQAGVRGFFSYTNRVLGVDSDGRQVLQPTPLAAVYRAAPTIRGTFKPRQSPSQAAASSPSSQQEGPDLMVTINPHVVETNYWFDPTPFVADDNAPAGKQTSLTWILLREIGHAWGVGGLYERNPLVPSSLYGTLRSEASPFDSLTRYVTVENNRNGFSRIASATEPPEQRLLFFEGKQSRELFGGPVPLANVPPTDRAAEDNFYHWECRGVLQGTLFAACPFPVGDEFFPLGELDRALLADIGLPLRADPLNAVASRSSNDDAASTTDAGYTSSALCFSGVSTVQERRRGRIPLSQLRVGDEVLVPFTSSSLWTWWWSQAPPPPSLRYERVYAFGHWEPDTVASFVQITTANDSVLHVSPRHLVFLANGTAVPAATLRAGQTLALVVQHSQQQHHHHHHDEHDDEHTRIRNVTLVRRRGVYAPFTPSGRIIVNDVVASNYIALDAAATHLRIGGIPWSYQFLAHAYQTPHRLLCTYVWECRPVTGIAPWLQTSLQWSEALVQQPPLVSLSWLWLWLLVARQVGLLLVLVVLLVAVAMETLLAHPFVVGCFLMLVVVPRQWQRIRQQRRRLLERRHGSRCRHEPCHTSADCASTKELWEPMNHCT